MHAVFDRVSMTISVHGAAYFPFEYEHALKPGSYADLRVRVWFHELLHLWQVLGSGFLANLACDQVVAVEEFERSTPGPVSNLVDRFAAKDAGSGFSASDLHEALARFWEAHVLNPVHILRSYAERGMDVDAQLGQRNLTWDDLLGEPNRGEQVAGRFTVEQGTRPYTDKAFDLLMTLEPSYAEPYRLMLSRFTSLESVIFFPLLGYFALQTPRPAQVFTALLHAVADSPLRSTLHREATDTRHDIHALWRAAYGPLWQLALDVAVSTGRGGLTPGWQVLAGRAGKRPILRHYVALLGWVRSLHGELGLDFALAVPGDPEGRRLLASFFLPAATVFDDGSYSRAPSSMTKLGFIMRNVPGLVPADSAASPSVPEGLLDAEVLAHAALEMRRIARAAARRALLAAYGVTSDQAATA
jgi:hypothetical protein